EETISEPAIDLPPTSGAAVAGAPSGAAPATFEESERSAAPRPVVIKRPPPITVAASASPTPPTSAPLRRSERETLRYSFEDPRLPVIPPEIRANILTDLLSAVEPRTTLNQAINKLKARYDFENVYRKREDIRTVARLAYRAGLFDFKPEYPSLSSYILRLDEDDPERANRQVDRSLLRVALESHIRLTPPGATSVLFAPARSESYCAELLNELTDLELAERSGNQYFASQTDAINGLLLTSELAGVRRDLEQFSLHTNDQIKLEEADRLFDVASDLRRHDFIASA